MSQGTEGLFLRNRAPQGGAHAALRSVGMKVIGEVVGIVPTWVKDFTSATGEYKLDKNGNKMQQINICLQTTHRNWEGVEIGVQGALAGRPMIPKDEGGNFLSPSEDTGLRWIYAKHRMIEAIGDALNAAGVKDGTVRIGATLGVLHHRDEDIGKGNPLPDFQAKYVPPAASNGADGAFQPAPQQAAPPLQQPAVAPSDPWAPQTALVGASDPWNTGEPDF